MKIIGVDDFDREHVSDVLIVENVDEYYGQVITDLLNEKWGGETANRFYKLVPDDHKLYVFEP